jgi:hypothetical protein
MIGYGPEIANVSRYRTTGCAFKVLSTTVASKLRMPRQLSAELVNSAPFATLLTSDITTAAAYGATESFIDYCSRRGLAGGVFLRPKGPRGRRGFKNGRRTSRQWRSGACLSQS